MKLRNGDQAIVDLVKLRHYCLCENHPRGRHKARVFRSVLGLTDADAKLLQDALLKAALNGDALSGVAIDTELVTQSILI